MRLFGQGKQFYRTMLAIAIPISLQSLVSFCVNLIDTIMLGQLGEIALSGSSLGSSFYMIINTVCMGLGGGAGVITAQYWGKKEVGAVRTMTAICVKLTVLLCAALTLVCTLLPTPILRLYTNDAAVIEAGASYLRVLSVTILFYGLTTSLTQILRSVGIARPPMFASAGACVVNIFFNWVFIFGNLGSPAMGIVGAAWGTNCARLVEFLVVAVCLLRNRAVGFRMRDLALFDRDLFRRLLHAGVPVLISDLVYTIGNQLVTVIVGHCGALFTAANSIANQVSLVLHALFIGVASSSSTLVGNAVGAGEYQRAYDESKAFLILCTLLGVVSAVLLTALQTPILSVFKVADETVVYARQMLTIQAFLLIITPAAAGLSKGILRGGGDTKFLIFGDTIATYIMVPFGVLVAFVFDSPIWLIYLVLKLDMVGRFIVCFARFRSKKWIRNVTLDGAQQAVTLNPNKMRAGRYRPARFWIPIPAKIPQFRAWPARPPRETRAPTHAARHDPE